MPCIGVLSEPHGLVTITINFALVRKAIAFPIPIVEPPPIATIQSAFFFLYKSRAAIATSSGQCGFAPSYIVTSKSSRLCIIAVIRLVIPFEQAIITLFPPREIISSFSLRAEFLPNTDLLGIGL